MTGCPAELLDALRGAGQAPLRDLDLPGDGTLVRYRAEGDKAGARNGWVVFHDGQHPAAAFGSWRTGERGTWAARRDKPLSSADRAAIHRQAREREAARRDEQARVHAEARDRARRLLAKARPATSAHEYLQRKRVHAFGLMQLRNMLVVPAYDAAGLLHTLQFIGPDGTKRMLTGGRIRGCYFPIGKPGRELLLCEGYATGATLRMATGQAVAVAFNAGNLLPVALALRAKFPRMRMVVCADNDRFTPGNPGVTAATAAAKAVRGLVVVPQFPERTE